MELNVIIEIPKIGIKEKLLEYEQQCMADSVVIYNESPISLYNLYGLCKEKYISWYKKADKVIFYCDLGLTLAMESLAQKARMNGAIVEYRTIKKKTIERSA